MRLAVSHLAWAAEEDAEARALLDALAIGCLEVAPARMWPDRDGSTPEACASAAAGSRPVVAFQSLLFGRPDLTLFESARSRENCAVFCDELAALAGCVGARAMVFGSPKNRIIPEGMSRSEAGRIAVDFFRRLGRAAAAHGVCFCLEPNPAAYGGNFLTHVSETADLIRQAGSPGVRLQVDAGELAMNAEDVESVIGENFDLIGHVHISQPFLDDFSKPSTEHARLARLLRNRGYEGIVSIEMKRSPRGLDAVREAITFAQTCYGAR